MLGQTNKKCDQAGKEIGGAVQQPSMLHEGQLLELQGVCMAERRVDIALSAAVSA